MTNPYNMLIKQATEPQFLNKSPTRCGPPDIEIHPEMGYFRFYLERAKIG
jgi:hypothetical protein